MKRPRTIPRRPIRLPAPARPPFAAAAAPPPPKPDPGDALTRSVIGEAMRVHGELGPGLDKRFYLDFLSACLRRIGVEHQCRLRGALLHRDAPAEEFESDIVVAGALILDLLILPEAVTFGPEHFAKLLAELKFRRLDAGLFLDFGKEQLVYRRVTSTRRPPPAFDAAAVAAQAPAFVSDAAVVRAICEAVGRVVAAHGLGYRDRTCEGLIAAELSAEQVPLVRRPRAAIRGAGEELGEAELPCITVAQTAAVMILALRDRITGNDRALLRTCLRHLGLPWGLIVNFGKKTLDLDFVAATTTAAPAAAAKPDPAAAAPGSSLQEPAL
jgi:GxxExxY protein